LTGQNDLGSSPMVSCGICGAIVDQANAKEQETETSTGRTKVWICKSCRRSSSGAQVRKYIMKEKKTVGR
jgi:hypothetical protein